MNEDTFTKAELIQGLEILLESYSHQIALMSMMDGRERMTFKNAEEFLHWINVAHRCAHKISDLK